MPSKRTIPRVCRHCGADFLARSSEVERGYGLYCSRPCFRAPRPSPITANEDGLTARIELSDHIGTIQGYATIDIADVGLVNRWHWRLSKGYATRFRRTEGTTSLHRDLLGLVRGDSREGDHIDRDRLNNRRTNLRIVPKGKNQQNMPARPSTSPFRGVSWRKAARKWVAQVVIAGVVTYLGLYDDEQEAARSALEARRRHLPYSID